ncbi:MAG: hypothetical protein MUE60_07245 [Candidatus Eisenbacteria bacterium]|jgi:hypothetical protein|nr:hypothetical protein [Candidatus Eisenbacteria bacterium]
MSSIIAENTIIASSYKNNSLPLEESGDRKLVLLTHDSHGYHIRILEFTDGDEWEVRLSLLLSSENCAAYPPTSGYIYSLAFFDDLGGSTQRFYVFLGYGREPGQSRIWYFVFDIDNSTYRFLNCGEFDNILTENGLATQYFRQLTLAPEDGDGICRIVVGYKQEFEETPANIWKSFFRVGYLTLDPDENTLSFNAYNPDYTRVLRVVSQFSEYFPKPIQYMGVIARAETYDLVVLTVGTVTPDDVLFVHELDTDTLRHSSGSLCSSLLDHPYYFAKTEITQHETTRVNISIVRNVSEPQTISFVRHSVEVSADVFKEYKIKLEDPHGEPDIPGDCKLFHLDSGDLTGHGNDDLVVIWKGCENCDFDRYILAVKDITPEADPGLNCIRIDFCYEFVEEFSDENISDLSEAMYVRYTSKQGGYFLSLFYHDTAGGVSVYVREYDF